MSYSLKIDCPKQVIVEGQDDVRVFKAMISHFNIPDLQVHECGGHPNLRSFLKTFKALPNFGLVQALAVVTDADSNRASREQGVREALAAAALPVPPRPLETASDGDLVVAYLIVPHGQDAGMIEDVCLNSVRADPAMECVERYFDCISQTKLPGPKDVERSKARVHAFLASRERPGLRLGEAAEGGIWDLGADAFQPLKNLIRML